MRRLLGWLSDLLRRREPDVERPPVVRVAAPANRRAFPRMKLDLDVKLQFESAGDVVDSRTVDISRSGVFLRMQQPRDERTKVEIELEVDGRPATLTGVVVRAVRPGEGSGPPGIGVLFTDLGDEQHAFLARLLSSPAAHE